LITPSESCYRFLISLTKFYWLLWNIIDYWVTTLGSILILHQLVLLSGRVFCSNSENKFFSYITYFFSIQWKPAAHFLHCCFTGSKAQAGTINCMTEDVTGDILQFCIKFHASNFTRNPITLRLLWLLLNALLEGIPRKSVMYLALQNDRVKCILELSVETQIEIRGCCREFCGVTRFSHMSLSKPNNYCILNCCPIFS